MALSLHFANTNTLWGSFLVETLVRAGIRRAVVCPGSRSAPLAYALAMHPEMDSIPVLDERSAAFFALGLARREGRAVVLVCTSGTAAGNFYPAVIEARESAIPLLVLTADRPPELRDCGSGQTIDQVKIFGHYPRWQAELALPEPSLTALAYLRQSLRHALERTILPVPGPVHLNVPFRDPLAPVSDGSTDGIERGAVEKMLDGVTAVPGERTPPSSEAIMRGVSLLDRSQRPLVIAGPEQGWLNQDLGEAAAAFCGQWKAPLIADALSSLRHEKAVADHLVLGCERLLARGEFPRQRPDLVIRIGALPASKRLRQWLADLDCPHLVLAAGDQNLDPLHVDTSHLRGDAGEFLRRAVPSGLRSDNWAGEWLAAGRRSSEWLEARMAAIEELFEGKMPWALARHLPAEAAVFISNSMPVRDADFFWPPGAPSIQVYANRGANGIDGIVSTAMGISHGGKPTFLITGELAFLHDQNGLLNHRHLKGALTIILINNGGGGIFHHLPIADFDPPFQEFFLTPQTVDFGRVCQAHGIQHRAISTWREFGRAVGEPFGRGIRVLEIKTDATADKARRRALLTGE